MTLVTHCIETALLGPGIKDGLVWKSNPQHSNYLFRNIPLDRRGNYDW